MRISPSRRRSCWVKLSALSAPVSLRGCRPARPCDAPPDCKLQFNVKVKTNGVMIHEPEARRLRELGVEQMQLSVYSHRPEVHDAITKLPGSLKRTVDSIKSLKSQGLKVTLANVLMTVNRNDHKGTQALAKQLGIAYTLDPTVTPMMDGNTSNLHLRVDDDNLDQLFADPELVLYGRQHERPVYQGLREILPPDRDPFGQHAAEGRAGSGRSGGADLADGVVGSGLPAMWVLQ